MNCYIVIKFQQNLLKEKMKFINFFKFYLGIILAVEGLHYIMHSTRRMTKLPEVIIETYIYCQLNAKCYPNLFFQGQLCM
jgi:hypothetical protein